MTIRIHNFVSSGKRYIQIESQPHHIAGIFGTITRSLNIVRFWKLNEAQSTYYKCEEDGTITFYQAESIDGTTKPGIWTYLVYECREGEEKILTDPSIDTTTDSLNELIAGKKLVQIATGIREYLKYQLYPEEYLDVQLPLNWNTEEGRNIAHLLLEECKAFKASPVFAEGVGKDYMKAVLNGFIEAAQEVVDNTGSVKTFETAQYDVLHKMRIDEMANLILEYNDYRIWQAALPSNSKAVEYAFNTALKLIYRIK
jgi:hypothetical protein